MMFTAREFLQDIGNFLFLIGTPALALYLSMKFHRATKLAGARIDSALAELKNYDRFSIHDVYDSVKQHMEDIPELGELWREFGECLHPSQNKIYNSVNPREFLNEEQLINQYADPSRWSNIPPLFTGIGILGTFVGLALGLANFDMATTDSLESSLPLLLGGIWIAFLSSVVGIICSLATSSYFTREFGAVQKKYDKLMRVIDELFIRHTEEEYLRDMARISEKQLTQLRNLADDLVEPLEQAITKGLSNELSPAIGQLIETVKQMAEARESSTEQFFTSAMDKFSASITGLSTDHADKIGGLISEAAEKIQGAADKFEAALHDHIAVLNSHSDSTDSMIAQLVAFESVLNTTRQTMADTSGDLSRTLEGLSTASQLLRQSIDKHLALGDTLNERIRELLKDIEISTKTASDLWSKHREGFVELNEALNGGIARFADETTSSITTIMVTFDKELARAVKSFAATIDELEIGLDNLSGILTTLKVQNTDVTDGPGGGNGAQTT